MVAEPSWFEHVDVMQALLVGLGFLVLFFVSRTLKKIDANQTCLFNRLNDLSEEFYTLKGEHNAIKNRCVKEA
jgi:hypothetical protein